MEEPNLSMHLQEMNVEEYCTMCKSKPYLSPHNKKVFKLSVRCVKYAVMV